MTRVVADVALSVAGGVLSDPVVQGRAYSAALDGAARLSGAAAGVCERLGSRLRLQESALRVRRGSAPPAFDGDHLRMTLSVIRDCWGD